MFDRQLVGPDVEVAQGDCGCVDADRCPERRSPSRRNRLQGAREVRWLERGRHVYTDATGEEDLGNIDTMIYDVDRYELTGDWGRVQILTPDPPVLTFT